MGAACSGLNDTGLEKVATAVAWRGFREKLESVLPCTEDYVGRDHSS